jgi:hypothetical protein
LQIARKLTFDDGLDAKVENIFLPGIRVEYPVEGESWTSARRRQ